MLRLRVSIGAQIRTNDLNRREALSVSDTLREAQGHPKGDSAFVHVMCACSCVRSAAHWLVYQAAFCASVEGRRSQRAVSARYYPWAQPIS